MKNTKHKYLLIAILICAIVFGLLYTSTFSIGKIINSIMPCQMIEADSFPCYAIYDIYSMIGLLIIIVALLAYFIYLHFSAKNK